VRVYRLETASRPNTQTVTIERTKPSIAVLPFTNMSGDAEQEYFSDGITEDIITELSRFRNLFVIARNSSFTYKGRAVDVKKVGRELGVAYVLEGSVRRAGNRVRITAQLIDAETGNHVWADRFDRELTDVFAVQDEITRRIAGTLAQNLDDDIHGRASRTHPENLAAYEHWIRGRRLLWTEGQLNLDARSHFERAIAADPTFARAHAGLAVTFVEEAMQFPVREDFNRAIEQGRASAVRSIELDHFESLGHAAAAWAYIYLLNYDRAAYHVAEAVRLNPNDADTLANAIPILMFCGRGEEAVATGRSALELNPRHPDWYLGFLASACFVAKRYEEGMALRLRCPEPFIDSRFWGAATLALMGREDEAAVWAAEGMKKLLATPSAELAKQRGAVQMLLDNNPLMLASDRERFALGMRKAGVPG
jgi:adenylate cyclase